VTNKADQPLDQRLRVGSTRGIDALYREHVRGVWQYIHRRVGRDRHTADDLVSSVFLAVVEGADRLDGSDRSPEGWLYGIARHKLADYLRVQYRQRKRQKVLADIARSRDALDNSQYETRTARVQQTLASLPAVQRDVLIWKYYDRLTVRRIAQRLGRSEKAAENMLYRARQRFRELYPLHQRDADEHIPVLSIAEGEP